MARGLPRGGATRRVRVETLSEGISEGRVLLVRRREAQTSQTRDLVWSKISNVLKRLGFRSHNFHTRLLSETLNSIYNPGSTIKFTEALE